MGVLLIALAANIIVNFWQLYKRLKDRRTISNLQDHIHSMQASEIHQMIQNNRKFKELRDAIAELNTTIELLRRRLSRMGGKLE
jgi:hypothetical protein